VLSIPVDKLDNAVRVYVVPGFLKLIKTCVFHIVLLINLYCHSIRLINNVPSHSIHCSVYSKSSRFFSESFLIRSTIPYAVDFSIHHTGIIRSYAYWWHNGFPILACNISEWHLCAFMLVDLDLGMVNIGDAFQGR